MIYSPEMLKKKEHFSFFLFFSLNTYETHNLSQGNTHSFYPTDPYPGRPYSGGGGGGVNLSPTAHAEYNETNNEWNDINALEPITAEDFNAVATKAAQAQDTATTADTKADTAQAAAEAAQNTANAALPAASLADNETDPTVPESIKDGIDWSELTGIPADFADGVDNNDAKLTEAEVDAYTANNGYLTTETDPTVNAAAKADLSTCAAGDVLLFGSSGWECSTNVSGTGKWSDGTTADSIVYTGGNVGIGTDSPNAKLEVNGEIIQTGSTRRGYTHYQDGSAEKLYHYLGRVESWCGAIGVEGQFESHNTTTRGTGNFDLSFARRDGFKVNGFASGLFGESLDIELYETEEGKATDFGLNLDVYLVTGTYAMTNINISQTPGCGEINTAEITPQEKSETSHDGEEPYYKLSTDGAAMFTDVNGNVGIGTTTPTDRLHVESSQRANSINRSCPAGTLWAGHIAGKASVDWNNDGYTDGNDYNILLGIDTNDYLEDNECVVFGTSTIGTDIDSGEFWVDTNLNRIVDEGEVITGANLGNLNVSGGKVSCEAGHLWLDQNTNGTAPETGECIAPQYDDDRVILRTDFTGETCPVGTQKRDENQDGNTDDGECHIPAVLAQDSGNLGIGTTDPQQALHVNGGLMASSLLLEDSSNPTLQAEGFFAHSHSIATNAGADFESFVIDGETYLAVANYYNDSTRDVDSKIYKWNSATSNFDEFQIIPEVGTFDFEVFVIDGEAYLAVINVYDGSSWNIDSKIYKWDGSQFNDTEKNIPTSGAHDAESFVIDGETYLAIPHYNDGSTYSLNSKIYKWNSGTDQFDELQDIPTIGPLDFESFVIDGETYLAVANYHDGSGYSFDSKIYKWNGSAFAEAQSIPTIGANHFESFTIDGEMYLAVANRHGISRTYKWNGSTFVEEQSFGTNQARAFESFVANGETYLAVANGEGDRSRIYKWNGSSFAEEQAIPTNNAHDVASFVIDGKTYLGVTNYYNGSTYNINSHIYTYDSFLTLSSTSTLAEDNPLFVFQNGEEELVTIENGGNVGIGTTEPTGALEVSSDINQTLTLDFHPDDIYSSYTWQSFEFNGEQAWRIIGRNDGDNNNASLNILNQDKSYVATFLQDGNVGIGTTSPDAHLEIDSKGGAPNTDYSLTAANASLSLASSDGITGIGTGTRLFGGIGGSEYAWFQAQNSNSETGNNAKDISLNPVGGNVGIGTTSPAANLEISSGTDGDAVLRIEADENNNSQHEDDNPSIEFFQDAALSGMKMGLTDGAGGTGNSFAFFVTKDGVESTTPALVIEQDGDLQIQGTATANGVTLTSDSRYKKEIQTLPSALENILSLRGVSYYWKDRDDDTQQIGVIAQEVEKIYPQLVHTNEDGYKSVAYSNLVSPLIEAVKELHALYQGHADRIAALEEQIQQLQERDAELEAQNAEWENHIAHQDERIAHQDELIVQLEVRLAALEAAQ